MASAFKVRRLKVIESRSKECRSRLHELIAWQFDRAPPASMIRRLEEEFLTGFQDLLPGNYNYKRHLKSLSRVSIAALKSVTLLCVACLPRECLCE